jgi:hypothetical protein
MNSIELFRRDHPALWLEAQAERALREVADDMQLTLADWIDLKKVVLAMQVLRGNRLIALRNTTGFQGWALRWLAAPVKRQE